MATIFVSIFSSLPANALTMKECSVKYKAAQSAGEAGGISWNEFRKAQCSAPMADAEAKADDAKPEKAEKEKPAKKGNPVEKAASGSTTFPSSIAAKFANEKPAKARMHTCLEQYHINKNANTLGGTRWIEKGGGYYKLCNARLKGND
ncbi:hypothetical protein [Phyllobacterium sp. SB3]|uniref:hypothetical protein n=1 Tax=Phyllobacterium sp. SB3 TaxID=3156073 RepID=UPI0032AF6984